ncbi:SDR family NAD(P)-dependent oxidoreductase [Natrarchaeobius chitinivorans]|uniref:SDR family oxidoreductase n=1 Tax=Natrarchaeobius chitinivorans TaxID=1679083 RepID=A0A3N6M014_NATCH|nr:SDR family oxidoreductase [Natrarchaeobius chitinivorans]RQG94867.1 SDR family oxidoreductase [Natrarchaeobius chitinivorans]
MANLLEGQTVVVTGGARGNGRGIALKAAENGANVVIADIREEPPEGEPTHVKISDEMDVEAAYVECDVTDLDDIEETLDVADELGGVDALVNNAGIFETADDFFDATPEDFHDVMNVNAMGPFFFSQRAALRMLEQGEGGSIVNVASLNARQGNGKAVVYSMAKAATKLMTYALAQRLGRTGIRVNAIHPGTIETPMTAGVPDEMMERFLEHVPQGRLGQPDDIAGPAVFLASDYASFVNGESITVDGGYASGGGITVPFDFYPDPLE